MIPPLSPSKEGKDGRMKLFIFNRKIEYPFHRNTKRISIQLIVLRKKI